MAQAERADQPRCTLSPAVEIVGRDLGADAGERRGGIGAHVRARAAPSPSERRNRANEKRPRPVILITDVGRDIDDTLALLTLNGLRRAGRLRTIDRYIHRVGFI